MRDTLVNSVRLWDFGTPGSFARLIQRLWEFGNSRGRLHVNSPVRLWEFRNSRGRPHVNSPVRLWEFRNSRGRPHVNSPLRLWEFGNSRVDLIYSHSSIPDIYK